MNLPIYISYTTYETNKFLSKIRKKKCLKIFYINLSYFCFVNVFSVLDFRLHLPWRMEGTITESKHIFQGSGSSLHSRSLYVLLLRCNGLSSRPAESSWRRWKCSESNKKYIFFKVKFLKENDIIIMNIFQHKSF